MLIRIAPDMFCDNRYGCVTIHEVLNELFRTQKFKTKYPWRTRYKNKIKPLGTTQVKKGNYDNCLKIIKNILETGEKNIKTYHYFNLSYIDQVIAASTIANNYILTTVDDDLADFVIQEFSVKTISPLEIINDWIEKKLIKWDDALQSIIEDWEKCNEHPQSNKEAKRFEKLSGYKYVGPKRKKLKKTYYK